MLQDYEHKAEISRDAARTIPKNRKGHFTAIAMPNHDACENANLMKAAKSIQHAFPRGYDWSHLNQRITLLVSNNRN